MASPVPPPPQGSSPNPVIPQALVVPPFSPEHSGHFGGIESIVGAVLCIAEALAAPPASAPHTPSFTTKMSPDTGDGPCRGAGGGGEPKQRLVESRWISERKR